MDNESVLTPYTYPSDPMIAERFYEEFSSANRSKTPEVETGKSKKDEKVRQNDSI